jgi:hypothetical protein
MPVSAIWLLASMLACTDDGTTADTGTPPTGVADDTGTTDTVGDCTDQVGSGTLFAVYGTVLAPEGPTVGHVVWDQATSLITCVGDCAVDDVTVTCTGGVVSPGLIDTHNHLQYNHLPPWQHDGLFDDRYDWRSHSDYYEFKDVWDEVSDVANCEVMKWAELRELFGGTTAAVGSYGDSCIDVLVRNLDEEDASHGLADYDLYYSARTVTSSVDQDEADDILADLADGWLDMHLDHVGEGVRGNVTDEVSHMIDLDVVGPGVAYVHATDATTDQLATMATTGTSIVWSPHSNLELYGDTTPVAVAERLGVTVLIGPDWTPSGTDHPAEELACAQEFLAAANQASSPETLWAKVTHDAAMTMGLDGVIGSLRVGARADIAVYKGGDDDPYASVMGPEADETLLVTINGYGLYGTTKHVEATALDASWCESLDVCGASRSVCVQSDLSGTDSDTLADVEATLLAVLGGVSVSSDFEYAKELYPLFSCEQDLSVCDPTVPTSDDADGDGVNDTDDLCPDHWDPAQADHDSDGTGDACDPCPLAANLETCDHTASDIDGDGEPNETDTCPHLYDADQADSDGDGLGDLCDPCPEEASPGGFCTVRLGAIADEDAADHPDEGTEVRVTGVVVTALIDGGGFYVQDPDASEHGGVYVYDRGNNTVELGQLVTVDGQYDEYYGLQEIVASEVAVDGVGTVPDPIVVSACDIGTAGADGERYEAMLVEVHDVTVTDENPDDPDDYGAMEVESCLWIDDDAWAYPTDVRAAGTVYARITGPLYWTFDQRRVLPRSAEDLEQAP